MQTDEVKHTEKKLLAKPLISVILLAIILIGTFLLVYRYWMNSLFMQSEIQHRQVLVQMVTVARNSIEPIMVRMRLGRLGRTEALKQVCDMVRTMTYEDEYGKNYIFMSSYDGIMLVQPFERSKEKTDQWDLMDANGLYIIRELVRAAKEQPSGSFVSYYYYLPGIHGTQKKLAYVVGLPELNCYIGTGMYMQQSLRKQQHILSYIKYGSIWLLVTCLIPVSAAMLIALNRNRRLVTEIEMRKIAEKSLRENEERLRGITTNIPGVVYQFYAKDDGEWGLTYASEYMEEFFGLTADPLETLLARFYSQIPDEDRERFRSSIVQSVETVSPWNLEARFIRPSGENIWFHGLSTPVRHNDMVVFDGIIMDITEYKLAQEALIASEEKFRSVFENAPMSIAISDIGGRYLDVNNRMCERSGLCREDIIGHSYAELPELFRYEDPGMMARLMHELNDQGRANDPEAHLIRPANNERTVNMLFTRLVSIGGKKCVISILLDITERKRLEEQLAQSQKMESIGRLAGGVAHDFNNMLGAILGYSQLALKKLDPANQVCSYLQEIEKAAERSANLTRQLLAFARRQTIVPRVIDLNTIVEGMLNMLQRIIGEDIQLSWHPCETALNVRIDPSQVDQILANLCVNAMDAIGDNGMVTISTAVEYIEMDGSGRPAGKVQGKYAILEVRDNGAGMDQETISHLFEPFFTTKEIGKGTGLGLATVYGCVSQNNGFIDVDSKPGLGTVFRIYLPLHTGEDIVSAGDESNEQAVDQDIRSFHGDETILLVEDEVMLLDINRDILKQLGYTVLDASTPGDALKLTSGYPGKIDLVITDVVMPGMNGRELAVRLVSIFPGIKRIFMSGYTADIIAHHGVLEKGMHFIQKPFTIRDLAETVRRVLDSR